MRRTASLVLNLLLIGIGGCASEDAAEVFSASGQVITGATMARDAAALQSGNPNSGVIAVTSADIRALVIEQDRLFAEGQAQVDSAPAPEVEPEP